MATSRTASICIVSLFCFILYCQLTYDGNDCAGCQCSAGHGYDRKFLLQPRHVSLQPLLLHLPKYSVIGREIVLGMSGWEITWTLASFSLTCSSPEIFSSASSRLLSSPPVGTTWAEQGWLTGWLGLSPLTWQTDGDASDCSFLQQLSSSLEFASSNVCTNSRKDLHSVVNLNSVSVSRLERCQHSLTSWRLVPDQKYVWYLQSPTRPPR